MVPVAIPRECSEGHGPMMGKDRSKDQITFSTKYCISRNCQDTDEGTRVIIGQDYLKGPSSVVMIRSFELFNMRFVFNCIHENICGPFKGYFQRSKHEKFTRHNSNILALLFMKLKFGQKSFAFAAGKIYNELPLDARKIESS